MLKFSSDPKAAEQQMNAIIFYMIAFGYIDGDFDLSEKTFVRDYIRKLVANRANDAGVEDKDIVDRWVTHFHEVFEETDHYVRDLFTEVVADGEDLEQFVYAKLKLRSYEIFRSFDADSQQSLLATIDELIQADGQVHPAEAKFRDEVRSLLDAEIPLDADEIEVIDADIQISEHVTLPVIADDHPFFSENEHHYSKDPVKIRQQAESDYQLIVKTMSTLADQRTAGEGILTGKQTIDDVAGSAPFLDGYTYVHPLADGGDYELTVLGDLHGCYSCLKAALMQTNFFAKVEAYRLDPTSNPNPKLIMLGDYIDRGRFSYNGVLRSVMQLFLTAPDHVYMLRGNHEYYLEYRGRIYGGVRPAEAINTLVGFMPDEMFEAYMKLFEALPNMLLFHRTLFVHAGIPRDADVASKWQDLSTLNDPDLRFQMLWSDPSTADYVPEELQAQSARFPFGKKQFERFMAKLGCTTMVRGHEKINEGFKSMYEDGSARLLNIFSAGGAENADLPTDSSYREVTPMALTIRLNGEGSVVTPWPIEYQRFNDPSRNAFFAKPPEIIHKSE